MELTPGNVEKVCVSRGAMQNPTEVFYLLWYLQPMHVRSIVELGVHRGGLAAAFRTFLPDAALVGVEIRPLGLAHPPIEAVPLPLDTPTLEENMAAYGFQVVTGSSYDPAVQQQVFQALGVSGQGKCVDLVFVDAAHDLDSVRRDASLWWPYARIMAFHDLYSPDVLKYWQSLTLRRTGMGVWKEPGTSCGIGLTWCE